MKKFYQLSIILTAVLFIAVSCGEDPIEPAKKEQKSKEQQEKERIEELIRKDTDYKAKVALLEQYMNVYYYWADNVSSRNKALKPYEYDIYGWFDALLYTPTDRWSWMEDKESYVASETGSAVGGYGTWGISVKQPVDDYGDYRIFLSRVLPGSPLERFGVTRGARIAGINDLDISEGFSTQSQVDMYNNYIAQPEATFHFVLADGTDTTFTAQMATSLSTNYILKTDVFTDEDFPGLTEPVGYFHYMQFAAGFVDDLRVAMEEFRAAGVKKMIVDLRYNGGGDSRASDALMGYLAPEEAAGKPYVTRVHNQNLAGNNQTQYISEGSLGLDEVFFILHKGSASASEMTYNGLRPYLNDKLHHVGGQSYGKPNGMYVLYYPTDDDTYNRVANGDYSTLEYVFYPICFYNFNSNGESIPSSATAGSGFLPDYAVPDDVYHDFGPQEADIKACLNYIVNGAFESAQEEPAASQTKAVRKGIRAIFQEEEINPNYGRCFLPMPEKFRK